MRPGRQEEFPSDGLEVQRAATEVVRRKAYTVTFRKGGDQDSLQGSNGKQAGPGACHRPARRRPVTMDIVFAAHCQDHE